MGLVGYRGGQAVAYVEGEAGRELVHRAGAMEEDLTKVESVVLLS